MSIDLEPAEHRWRAASPSRLLIVEDHPAVLDGLRELLADERDFEVTAAVASAEAALRAAEREPIDVAVVDYQLEARNGLWLSRKLKRLPSAPRVLIYSAYADGVLAAAAVATEADGLVSKGVLGSQLCDEIRAVRQAGACRLRPLPPWLRDTIHTRFGHDEQAIFGMLLAGIEPDEIADTLGLSAGALESVLWTMLRKLEASP